VSKESNLIKIKKVSSEATHFPAKVGGKFADGSGPYPPLKTSGILLWPSCDLMFVLFFLLSS